MRLRKFQLLRLCAVLVLALGLGCAVAVYVRAPEDAGGGIGYVTEGGQVYDVRPEDSRSYQRGLEYIGGKSAVLGVELREKFAGLWRGDSLAVLIALAAAGGCVVLLRLADKAEEKGEGRKRRGE
jgi:hypothetical protein